jgi:hypothetical protein
MRSALVAFVATAVFLSMTAAAETKEFEPGDLRICNVTRCVPVMNRPAVRALAVLYYTGTEPPRRVARPALGARSFELRFENSYVTGIVATARLDRFLSYGVNTGRLQAGQWYRVPAKASRELRRLAAGLVPLRLTRAALAKSR